MKLISASEYDKGKLVISTTNASITGKKLQIILHDEHKIEIEMSAADFAIAMTSVCDTRDTFVRLADALIKIDSGLSRDTESPDEPFVIPERVMTVGEARQKRGEIIEISCSRGRVALEYVWAYPPGIPLIVPGEIINSNTIENIANQMRNCITLNSDYGLLPEIMCMRE